MGQLSRRRTRPAAIVEGEIKNITEFGLFVGLAERYRRHGASVRPRLGASRARRPSADYKKGETVKAKVLDVDVEKERISLGIKQLGSDPFQAASST